MGDLNQLKWVRSAAHLVKGPILEVGSRHYRPESAIDYRGAFPGYEYVGTDLTPGDNVDVVADFSSATATLLELFGRDFGTVICCSALEHCARIVEVAANIAHLTRPGGVLFVSVPFVWRFHGYPSDYWRVTPEGMKQLFPAFEFPAELATLSSNRPGEIVPLNDAEGVNHFAVRSVPKTSGLARLLGGKSDLEAYPYVLVPVLVNMVGIRR